tara:strand:- start:290 stop:904 length:615 start_codon:yes stop_codon:yes gene_type:complete
MSYIKFFLKKKALQIKSNLFIKSKPGSCDSYPYKWNRIKKYANDFNAKIFVETGTYYGVTIDKMIPYFESIYSIEIDQSLYTYNSMFYKNNSAVKLKLGDSKFILPEILSTIKKDSDNFPVIFWLDGHYSGHETGIGDDYSPICSELKTITTLQKIKSIIIIDDLRLFDGKDYPTLDEVISSLPLNQYRVIEDQDALVLIDNSL